MAAASSRSAALVALEIGQAVLFLGLLAITTVGAAASGAVGAVPSAVAAALLFIGGLVVHRRLGSLGRGAWVIGLLVAGHLLDLVSPSFVWLAFPLWLLIGQALPLAVGLPLVALSVTVVIMTLGASTSAAVVGPLVGALVAVGLSRGVMLIEAEAQRHRDVLAQVVSMQAEAARLSDGLAVAQREAGVQAERARLAHDIHDTLAQGFSSIVLLARAAARQPDADARLSLVRQIETTASDHLDEARAVVRDLAPDALAAGGLTGPLLTLAEALRASTGAEVTLDVDPGLPRLPTSIEVALLRAAQGALANVHSHAGASHVRLTLTVLDDEVRLDVVDDGRGFDPATLTGAPTLTGGYGLRALRERLVSLGGGVDVESEPGGGTAVSLHCPVPLRGGPR